MGPSTLSIASKPPSWRRHEHVRTVSERLADDGRIRPAFTMVTADACIDAATGFPACDAITERTGLAHDRPGELVLSLLSSVVDLAGA